MGSRSAERQFLGFSAAISEVLGEGTRKALISGCPWWLSTFVRLAHHTRSTLITFNYDTLIECSVAADPLYELGMKEPVHWTELTNDVPSWPPGAFRLAAQRADTFRLLKLHGSLNWYWAPEDQAGVSVSRRDLPGRYGEPRPYQEGDRQRELPGRVPFIVPPAAAKSPYYRNPITREVWRQAAAALASADRIVIIGYSLPLTDLTFSSMLRGAISYGRASVVVVDQNPAPVQDRLVTVGVDTERLRAVQPGAAPSVVSAFIHEWTQEVATTAAAQLATQGVVDAPMAVIWDQNRCATVTAVGPAAGGVLLTCDPPGSEAALGRRNNGELMSDLPKLRELRSHLRNGSTVQVRVPQERCPMIIKNGTTRYNTGHGEWNALYPNSARPPSPSFR